MTWNWFASKRPTVYSTPDRTAAVAPRPIPHILEGLILNMAHMKIYYLWQIPQNYHILGFQKPPDVVDSGMMS